MLQNTLRLSAVLVVLAVLVAPAWAGLVNYELMFMGTGNVGPGQFMFDSGMAMGTIIGPPVMFPSFMVMVSGMSFMPMSPKDDSVMVDRMGHVSALMVDLMAPVGAAAAGETLQLNMNTQYQLFDAAGGVIGQGGYAATAIPEPATLGLWLSGLAAGLLLLRRRA